MEAKEMFEVLGYEKPKPLFSERNGLTVSYIKHFNCEDYSDKPEAVKVVIFDNCKKEYVVRTRLVGELGEDQFLEDKISIHEHNAIHKQMEEWGWLNEN